MAFPALHSIHTLACVLLSAFYFLCLPAAMTTLVFLFPLNVSYHFFHAFESHPGIVFAPSLGVSYQNFKSHNPRRVSQIDKLCAQAIF